MAAPLIGAGLSLLGGLFGSRSARRAARRQQQLADEMAGRVRSYAQGAAQRGGELGQFLPEYATVSPGTFRPVNLTTGYGTTQYNPATGQYEQQLSAPLAQQQQFAYGAAQDLAKQLAGFDPQAFAQRRFEGYQSLLAPQREAATAQLAGTLKRKGLLGWAQTPVGGTSTERYNPLTAGFARAIGEQDKALAMQSLGEGTAEQERLANLQARMFGRGMDINVPLTEQLRYGYNLGGDEYRRAVEASQMANQAREAEFLNRQRLFQLMEPFEREAALGGMDQQAQAAGLMNQARLGQSAAISGGLQNLGGMFMGGASAGMPSLGGMFGPYFRTSPTSAVSSEISRLGSSTMNPMSGYWTGRDGWGSYGE